MDYTMFKGTPANMRTAHYLLSIYYGNFNELNRLSELCPDAEWKGRYKQKALLNKTFGLIAHDRTLNDQQLSPAFDKEVK